MRPPQPVLIPLAAERGVTTTSSPKSAGQATENLCGEESGERSTVEVEQGEAMRRGNAGKRKMKEGVEIEKKAGQSGAA
jgi:hypothetical protein